MNRQEEFEIKLERVRAWLQAEGIGSVLLSSQANFAWLTAGGDNHVSLGDVEGVASILVTPVQVYLLTSNVEIRRLIEEEAAGLPFEPVESKWFQWYQRDDAKRFVSSPSKIDRMVSDSSSLGLAPVPASFDELRYTMLPAEVERYRVLGQEATQAVENACLNVQPGESELEVAASVAYECQRRNILPLVNLVAADDRIPRYRHPLPTDNPVRHTLLVALTGRRYGLHISLTRMVSFGPLDVDLEHRQLAVAKVDARLNLESLAGASLGGIFQKGIEQYANEGFPQEWQLHHQGGLTGYSGREIFAVPGSEFRLGSNQVLTWNPSITGTKSEDTVLLAQDGLQVLTRTGDWPELLVGLPIGRSYC